MKEKIQQLIESQKLAKNEVHILIEELSQIDEDKISYQEFNSLNELKAKYTEELELRLVFINELEDLL